MRRWECRNKMETIILNLLHAGHIPKVIKLTVRELFDLKAEMGYVGNSFIFATAKRPIEITIRVREKK